MMKKRADSKPVNAENEAEQKQDAQGSKRSVAIYVITLIIVVLACIILSFFISQRNEDIVDTMTANMTKAEKNIELLQEKNVELTTENSQLKTELDDVRKQKSELQKQTELLKEQHAEEKKQITESYNREYNELLAKYEELKKQLPNNKENGEGNNA